MSLQEEQETALTCWKPSRVKSPLAMTGESRGWRNAFLTMKSHVALVHRFLLSSVSTAMEKRLTDSCVEMPSTQSRWCAKRRAQRTVCSACGLPGPPAHTPAPAKPQKGSSCAPAPSWRMQVKEEFSAQTVVPSRKHAAVTSTLALCTIGRPVHGDNA